MPQLGIVQGHPSAVFLAAAEATHDGNADFLVEAEGHQFPLIITADVGGKPVSRPLDEAIDRFE